MKKIISSAVVASALLSTSAFAFESLKNGLIVTSEDGSTISSNWYPNAEAQALDNDLTNTIAHEAKANTSNKTYGNALVSGYTGGVPATTTLRYGGTKMGDALIYPAYTVKNGFSTEIKVVNSHQNNAIVAKAVLYSADDSRELKDFNIYLSPNDVFKFELKKDGDNLVLTTADDSYMIDAINPAAASQENINGNNVFVDDPKMVTQGTEVEIARIPLAQDEMAQTGYVVIYGMTEASSTSTGVRAYDKKHAELAQDYRRLLDITRPNWRTAITTGNKYNGMHKGMFTASIVAPNVTSGRTSPGITNGSVSFQDVSASLFGSVTLNNTKDGRAIFAKLPATALLNFTSGNMLLWTEGEFASLQDRNIVAHGGLGQGDAGDTQNVPFIANNIANARDIIDAQTSVYDIARVANDVASLANTFTGFTYDFNKDDKNQMLFTQPLKRIIVQLGDNFNNGNNTAGTNTSYYQTNSGLGDWNYKGFNFSSTFYDESENIISLTTAGRTSITSPFNSTPGAAVPLRKYELSVFNNEDLHKSQGVNNKDTAGWGRVNVTRGLPAIATQWIGADTTNGAAMNWVYLQ